jgi:hypothetical protein
VAKVHLGIIVGNEAANIVRFLDSFQPHVDSVSVVRACGNQTPDASLDIAKARGCLVGEYKNANSAADWEHIDNFAAARSQSFAMAPEDADWIMWADCDDLLMESAQACLQAVRGGRPVEGDVLYAPYVTSANGNYARRVRMVRRAAYRQWINAVHEDIEYDPAAKLTWAAELQVIHLPENNKRNSPKRNRRILEAVPEAERTGREWWFLFKEAEVQNDLLEAMKAAVIATGCPDLGDEEKFRGLPDDWPLPQRPRGSRASTPRGRAPHAPPPRGLRRIDQNAPRTRLWQKSPGLRAGDGGPTYARRT